MHIRVERRRRPPGKKVFFSLDSDQFYALLINAILFILYIVLDIYGFDRQRFHIVENRFVLFLKKRCLSAAVKTSVYCDNKNYVN